jgi:hypothetical protein
MVVSCVPQQRKGKQTNGGIRGFVLDGGSLKKWGKCGIGKMFVLNIHLRANQNNERTFEANVSVKNNGGNEGAYDGHFIIIFTWQRSAHGHKCYGRDLNSRRKCCQSKSLNFPPIY